MVSALVPQLKKLVTIDNEIRRLMEKIERATTLINEDSLAIAGVQKQLKELNDAYLRARKDVDLQELESKVLRDREVACRAALDQVKSQKEYAPMMRELEGITRERSAHDDLIIKVWHHLELAEKRLASEKIIIEERIKTLNEEKATKEAELAQLTAQLDAHEQERQTAAVGVPEEWLTKYLRMRLRVADPIVHVNGTCCSVCYYMIAHQEMTRLKAGALLICRNCYRFLYLDLAEVTEANKATY